MSELFQTVTRIPARQPISLTHAKILNYMRERAVDGVCRCRVVHIASAVGIQRASMYQAMDLLRLAGDIETITPATSVEPGVWRVSPGPLIDVDAIPATGGTGWTEDEKAQLRELYHAGKTRAEIIQALGRSKMSVVGKLDRMMADGEIVRREPITPLFGAAAQSHALGGTARQARFAAPSDDMPTEAQLLRFVSDVYPMATLLMICREWRAGTTTRALGALTKRGKNSAIKKIQTLKKAGLLATRLNPVKWAAPAAPKTPKVRVVAVKAPKIVTPKVRVAPRPIVVAPRLPPLPPRPKLDAGGRSYQSAFGVTALKFGPPTVYPPGKCRWPLTCDNAAPRGPWCAEHAALCGRAKRAEAA